MYTRSYTNDIDGIVIPEGYDGAALRQSSSEDIPDSAGDTENAGVYKRADEAADVSADVQKSDGVSILSSLPFGNYLSSIFKKGRFSLQNIGFEEILIIGVALYLLFSGDGDKECAIMLIILLFIN